MSDTLNHDMGSFNGKRVLIFQQRGWGTVTGHMLAKRLQAEGASLAALTLKRVTHAFTLEQKDVRYEQIVNHDDIMDDPFAHLDGAVGTLADVCADLGIDSVWPFVMCLRNYVRSYGEKYYYGWTPNVSDEVIIAYARALHRCASRFFETFKPDVILAPNFVGLVHMMFCMYARKRGVPMIALTDSKVRGIHMFCYDYTDANPYLAARAAELDAGGTSANEDRARQYIAELRESYKRPPEFKDPNAAMTPIQRLRAELKPLRDIIRWYFKRPVSHLKNIGVTADYRPPRIILRDHFAKKAYKRFMDRFPYDDLGKVGRFAYLPLQFQPEETIDVKAPFFANQIETARQIAMSMPDDMTLVVKEHPAMVGYRPPSYVKKIARLVNVNFIDYRIPNDAIMRRADLVIGQNSTSIAEAAFYNKPAIQLGDLATTQLLPNVRRHTDMTTLAHAIREALKADVESEAYERKLRKYVAAAYDVGFEVDFGKLWEDKGLTDEAVQRVWTNYRAEISRAIVV